MIGKVGFVGLGAMGLPMAENLIKRQFRVTGFDVRAEAVAKLEALGGAGAASAREAAQQADVLVLMVVSAEQAEAVLFEGGALAALAENAMVVLTATCSPGRVISIAERVAATGRHLVDAPVSGGVAGVVNGTLTVMAAAPRPVFDRAEPILSAFGSNVFYLGDTPGQGAAMKVVNQLLCGVHIAVAAEGLAFAERSGIDPEVALKILSGSAASSWMLQNRGGRMVKDDGHVTSAVDIFVKDLGIVLDAGRSAKMGLPLAAIAHQLFVAASGMGAGGKDDSQVIDIYRALGPSAKRSG
jgi:3-hydroxyisobutyrate dehydrogenase